ncbi:protein mono-ADP-ribosyltransferase PARP14-like isoform X2 [Aquarana catesbeiana]|uniref:protein mono-ADP-ribosyltransferase PARP14-like isoform X2 n=1 Tax=Aquarana catesbeiana TaxID=8400 RepID=UPI003CC9B227
MGDPQYPYPVSLQWDDGPQRLKKLKNKLLLYFQKRSEFTGGECEIRDTDCTQGYILIHFKEEKARDRVLQKGCHLLKLPNGEEVPLTVSLPNTRSPDTAGNPPGLANDSREDLTPQPPAAEALSNQSQHVTQEPPSSSLILIENLQDTYSLDILNLLVENISGMRENTDFQVERIPEKQCAFITFTCDIDILRFVKQFSENSRVQSLKMMATPLKETRTIRIEGLPTNTSKEYISLYFENPKHGVPESMEDTLVIADESAALVTFFTVEAAKKVLGRKHLFQKKEVSIYPYYPAQGIVLYGDQRPQIQTPEPLTFPVSPYILEFILSNIQFKENMEKTMGTHTCEIKWPDQVCPNPLITLSFPEAQSTHLRTLAKLLPTWKDKVHAEFSLLISKYKVVEYQMDQSVWDAVKEHASSSTYNGVLIKPELGSGKVFLVGLLEDITRIDPTFRQLIEETTKQVQRKSQSMTETLPMSPALYQSMCNRGLQKKILDQVPELKMDYDTPKKEIRLSGLRDEVLTAKCEILSLQNQLETKSTQINPQLAQFPMSTDNEGSQSSHVEKKSSGDKATPDDDVTLDLPSSLVIVKNVQDSCTLEMLNLLVENTSGKVMDTDFYIELIPEIQSAVVSFTCDIDIPRFISTFCSNLRVAENKLTARPLEESQSVRVENVPDNTSETHLAAFFENPRQGGGRVKEIAMLPEERAALIMFYDMLDVKRVLKKDHVFSKKKISVYPYYPLLGIALYGKDRPCIEIPKPIEFNISPYIFQHICNNKELKNNIDVKMKNKHCEIKWPDQDCQDPVLQLLFPPTLSTHLRSVTKIVPRWKEEVYNEFSLLIEKFRVLEYKMDQSVWETIREHVSSSTYDGVLIKPDCGREKVFLVGLSNDVTRIEPTFRQLVEENTKQVERKKQTKTETLSMSPALYQNMCNSGQKKKILDQVPELNMDYDVPRKEIRLSGLRDEVLTAKCEILNIKQQMKTKSIQMNPHLMQFLMFTDNEEISSTLFVNRNINAVLEIEDDAVQLMAYSKKDLTEAEEQMNEELICKEVPVEEKSILKSPEWGSFQSHLLESCNAEKITVLILESHSESENNVVIAGLSSNVDKCYHKVSDFLDTPMEKNIKVKSLLVMQFLKEEKKQMLDGLKNDNLSVVIHNKNIRLRGPRRYVAEAHSRISDVLSSLCSDTLTIDKPGAKKFCSVNEEINVTKAKNMYGCLIHLQKKEEEDELEDMEDSRHQVTSKKWSSLMDRNTSVSSMGNVSASGTSQSSQSSAGGGPELFTSPKAPMRVQKLTTFQLMDGIEPAVFSLCAEDKRSVDRTKAWLQQMIDNEQAEKVITEECISELEEAEVQKISDLQKRFQVSLIYKPPDPSIRIVGQTRDVLFVSGEIEMIVNRVKYRKNRERAAELTGNLVEWRYGNGGTMVPFDMMTNLELEEAKNDNKAQITIQIRGSQYTVSLQAEKAIDKRGNQIQIQRVVKHEGDSLRLPSYWKPMGKTVVMEVDVAPGTREYSAVQQKFERTCRNQILKILRVQNRDLWLNYQIKKQNIDSKNSSTTNEKELFHGTDFNSIQDVNQNGFNRSYAGRKDSTPMIQPLAH